MDGEIVVDGVYPWPASVLSPNNSSHWTKKSKAKKAHREGANRLTKVIGEATPHHRMSLEVWLQPPTRRHYDTDNALARLKSTIDGIFDALEDKVDDRQIDTVLIHRCPPLPKEGQVRIVLRVR